MPEIAITLFGTPRIKRDGQTVSVGHTRAVALLAYLAVTQKRHGRASLAAFLWPEHDESRGLGEVRRMLWALNRTLGKGWLDADRHTIEFPPQPGLYVDVNAFRRRMRCRLDHGHAAQEVCAKCLEELGKAVELSRDPFLDGFTVAGSPQFDTWQRATAEALRGELVDALERLVQIHLLSPQGSTKQALLYAQQLTALEPFDGRSQQIAMLLNALRGRPQAAVRQYRQYEVMLKSELGVSVTEQTRAIFERVQHGPVLKGDVLELLPFRTTYRYTGNGHVANGSRRAPATHTASGLPQPLTPFLGRERELAQIGDLLQETRLVSVVALGGMGKTRLALRVAVDFEDRYSHGVHFVPLAGVTSAADFMQALAEALKIPLAGVGDLSARVIHYLRQRQLLLLLDNCEDLGGATTEISDILRAAPGVTVLATSRERLNLAGESVFPLKGLAYGPLNDLAQALDYDAVRLFLKSAQRVSPAFELRPGALAPLAHILQLTGGMPLGLELAAAWVDTLSMKEIAEEVERSLEILETSQRDRPARHQDIYAILDRSWERLGRQEQEACTALTVFRNGFDRAAVQAVAGVSDATLLTLIHKSLLHRDPLSGRYNLHVLVRQYARELQAEDGAQTLLRAAHATYYVELLGQLWESFTGRKQTEALAICDQELENLRAAWSHTVRLRRSDLLLQATPAMWMLYEIRGWSLAGKRLFAEAAEALRRHANDGQSAIARACCLAAQSWFETVLGDPETAGSLAEESAALLSPEAPALARYLSVQALAMSTFHSVKTLRDLEDALEQTIRDAEARGERWWQAVFIMWSYGCYFVLPDAPRDKRRSKKAATLMQVLQNPWGTFWSGLPLARRAVVDEEYEEAQAVYELILDAAEEIRFQRGIATIRNDLGQVQLCLERTKEAGGHFRRALRLAAETDNVVELLQAIVGLGHVRMRQGDNVGATELLSLVYHHPGSGQRRSDHLSLQKELEPVRRHLQCLVPDDDYQSAWERGRRLDLDTTVVELLDG